MIDIGAGTMDVLLYDDKLDSHYKAVVKSPARLMAESISATPGALIVTGCEMGGSPVSSVLKSRAKDHRVYMTQEAAATIHHQIDKVTGTGIKIVAPSEVLELKKKKGLSEIILADLDIDRIRQIVESFGEPFVFDTVGICAQDHGRPPEGVSHLDFRNQIFQSMLDKDPAVHTLLFRKERIPSPFNRLKSIAKSAEGLPTQEVFVMDSGMAAILGASLDRLAMEKSSLLVLDIATSHTVGAAWKNQTLAGFFEYHTQDITLPRLEALLQDLANGDISHHSIVSEGGHGAYIRDSAGFSNIELILATGPKRRMISKSRLPIVLGAPWGDNMMTGNVGLLASILRQKGCTPISFDTDRSVHKQETS